MHRNASAHDRHGISMLELLAAVTIIGIVSAALIPRISGGAKASQRASCHVNRHVIEIQASLWRREKGSWPSAALTDIGESTKFFPEGKPACPIDGTQYRINTSTGRVFGHDH